MTNFVGAFVTPKDTQELTATQLNAIQDRIYTLVLSEETRDEVIKTFKENDKTMLDRYSEIKDIVFHGLEAQLFGRRLLTPSMMRAHRLPQKDELEKLPGSVGVIKSRLMNYPPKEVMDSLEHEEPHERMAASLSKLIAQQILEELPEILSGKPMSQGRA